MRRESRGWPLSHVGDRSDHSCNEHLERVTKRHSKACVSPQDSEYSLDGVGPVFLSSRSFRSSHFRVLRKLKDESCDKSETHLQRNKLLAEVAQQ